MNVAMHAAIIPASNPLGRGTYGVEVGIKPEKVAVMIIVVFHVWATGHKNHKATDSPGAIR